MLKGLVYTARGKIPHGDRYVELAFPENKIERLRPEDVGHWDDRHATAARHFGDRWIEEVRTAILVVPSVVTRLDENAVVNPAHEDFSEIVVSVERPVNRRLFEGTPRGR